jgi:hypothetical protein
VPVALDRSAFRFPLPLVASLALVCAAVIGLSIARAAETPFGPQRGVLLLRNGELIEGEITLSGDRYDVAVSSGQMHIRRADVEFVGRTVLECYQRRRALVSVDKVQEHLELAEWCMRHHLYDETALALADAVGTDASHPRIGLLERRLKFELEREPATPAKSKEAETGPSSRDLDRLVQGLPRGSVEMFADTIQPMLLNHCSTAGCHGPQGTASLRLLRIPGGKAPSRRATQRNLYAVLSAVDHNQPGQSPLLLAPMRPHGQAKSAVFTTRETLQYQQLVRWVHQVSNQPTPTTSAALLSDPHYARSVARQQKTSKSAARKDSKPQEPDSVRPGVSHLANQRSWPAFGKEKADEPLPESKPLNWDETEEDTSPPADEDAFDPGKFNERYLKAPGE